MNETMIRYVFIAERVDMGNNMILPPMCNTSLPIYQYLGRYPKNLDQLALGADYYSSCLFQDLNIGYNFNVVYLDSLYENPSTMIYDFKDSIQLLFISVNEENIIKLKEFLSKNHCDTICYQCINMDSIGDLSLLPNYMPSYMNFLNYLFINTPRYISEDLLKEKECYSVPLSVSNFDRGNYFSPTKVNTFTIQNIWGNFGGILLDNNISQEESLEKQRQESQDAIDHKDEFIRQNRFIPQLKQIDHIVYTLRYANKNLPLAPPDNIYSPLILVAPFNNSLLGLLLKIDKTDSDKDRVIKKVYKKILESEQTPNYTHESISKNRNEDKIILQNIPIGMNIFKRRITFLDNAGFLHSSFTFSPYVRLPVIGKSIYNQLSYVAPKAGSQLVEAGNVRKIKKKVSEVGNAISNRILSKDLKEYIKKRDSQIVAITDMPIEWTLIDDIPLGFSHDICRIPETPVGGVLSHYMNSFFLPFNVSIDILKKTLVVFGCTDTKFAIWQQVVLEMQKELGFEVCVCTSVDQFVDEVKEKQPQLLIIDSHGDYDPEKNESFLMLGKEKLRPADIADNFISVPLVFLSACNTAPTYDVSNIIANAFFQVGAKSVTSSYLPLDIRTSSVTYIRLLRQLSMCAKQSIHKNWLAFVSHIFRTSFIMEPYLKAIEEKKVQFEEVHEEQSEMVTKSMFFRERNEIYKKLTIGFEAKGKVYNIDSILPEYLFYSNLGRSDLIYFESWQLNHKKKIESIS